MLRESRVPKRSGSKRNEKESLWLGGGNRKTKWLINTATFKSDIFQVRRDVPDVLENRAVHTVDSDLIILTGLKITVPYYLSQIKDEIERSRYIMGLNDNWDENGAYAIDSGVWEMAVKFMLNYSKYIYEKFRVIISPARIDPGRDGSIDLLWRTDRYRMLVNIPKNDSVSYYGDDYTDNNSIKGTVDVYDTKDFLASWMKNLSA